MYHRGNLDGMTSIVVTAGLAIVVVISGAFVLAGLVLATTIMVAETRRLWPRKRRRTP